MRNPALQGLNVLVGEWEMENPRYPEVHGRAAFAWLEGGTFLVQHAEVAHPLAPNSTMIIGRDETTELYCILYYDERGVSRVYQMSLSADIWKMWRDSPGFSQRFIGTFSNDGRIIKGGWEKSADGSNWEHDFDLTYTKVL
jgi:hypothetical protein